MKNAKLWEALDVFLIDDPESSFRFSERLARENGWSAEYTERVLIEYRKFLYLCAVAGHPVTPSDAVDQAWHLHLCYTRSYWTELCEGVLGFPLHHGPTKGGAAERVKYADWYGKTLQRYSEEFGMEPPCGIWPATAERFANRNFRRVDVSSHLILPRKTLAYGLIGSGALVLLGGCAGQLAFFLDFQFVLVAFIILVVVVAIVKGGKGGKGGSGCGGGWFGGSGCGGGSDSGCGGGGGCGGCGGGD